MKIRRKMPNTPDYAAASVTSPPPPLKSTDLPSDPTVIKRSADDNAHVTSPPCDVTDSKFVKGGGVVVGAPPRSRDRSRSPNPSAAAAAVTSAAGARQFASGRRTPEYFLQQRHVKTAAYNSASSAGGSSTGGGGANDNNDVVVVIKNHARSSSTSTSSTGSSSSSSSSSARSHHHDTAAKPTMTKHTSPTPIVIKSRITPEVDSSSSSSATSSGKQQQQQQHVTRPPPILQRSASGRAFPDSQLFERRSEVFAKRAEKQKTTAQRLYGGVGGGGGRKLPSTPVAAGARVSGGAVGGGSTEQVATAAAERTKFEPFTGAPLRSCMRTPSPSLHKMNNSSVAAASTSSASDDVMASSFVAHQRRQQSSTATPSSGNSVADDQSTPTSSRDNLSVTRGGGERHRQRSRDHSGARDASRDRSRDRSRSPWQMMLASNRRIRQPGPSMSSLGRSIARSLTPSLDQMTTDQPVDHGSSSSCSDQNSSYPLPAAAAAEPVVAPPSLQRGRSEPNLIDAVNDACAQQHKTEVYGSTTADGSVTPSYDSTSPSTRSYSTLPTAGKRASIARERRLTMGDMTSCGDGDDGASTLYSPRSDGLMVSQRFLRLSQGDLTSQSTSNLEALMQNTSSPQTASAQSSSSAPSPLERGVRRTNSLRDFRRSRAAAAAAAANSDVSADSQLSRNVTGVTPTNQTPVNVFNDDDNGLVGYVFHV